MRSFKDVFAEAIITEVDLLCVLSKKLVPPQEVAAAAITYMFFVKRY